MNAPQPDMLDRHYEFVSSLQSALSVSDIEEIYLQRIDGLIPARTHALYHLDPETGEPIGAAVGGAHPALFAEPSDAPDAAADALRAAHSDIPRPRTVWEASEPYRCSEDADRYHSMECPVLVAGLPSATLHFVRGPEDPPFAAADLRTAQRIGEQVGLALERAQRYEDSLRRSSLLETALDHLPLAVVVTDLDANVLFSNRNAAAKIPGGQQDEGAARDALKEAMSQFRRHNKRVNVTAVSDRTAEEQLVMKSIRLGPRGEASVSVFYTQAADDTPRLPAWEVLSPREQEIAEYVSRGMTTKQIAEHAFVTENTVKQHLKRIFTKVDVRNRAELLQRIWTAGDTRVLPGEGSPGTDDGDRASGRD